MIVNKHKNMKNAHLIWKEICKHYDVSMASTATQATNAVRLVTAHWKDSHQSFITNYYKHLPQHILAQKKENQISNNMTVNMLNAALIGVTHLKDCLNRHCTARKGAGVAEPFKISFEECISCLIATSETHDAANGALQRTRSSITASVQTDSSYASATNDSSAFGLLTEEEDGPQIEVTRQTVVEKTTTSFVSHEVSTMCIDAKRNMELAQQGGSKCLGQFVRRHQEESIGAPMVTTVREVV